jgi:ankyrin repeat protein
MSQQFLKFIQRGATAEVADAIATDPSLLCWRDAQGVSALLWSIYSGQTLVRDFLLMEIIERMEMAIAGISIDTFEAAAVGNPGLLTMTLEATPEAVNEYSGDGWTPLHLAAAFGTPEAVRLLLDRGAPVDAVSTNAQKNQPLHAALALGRNPETIQMLLAAGANPNARQTAGFTAIFSAAAANRRDLVELLVSHGADAAIRNDFGQNAAGFARERGHTELADWLDSLPAA